MGKATGDPRNASVSVFSIAIFNVRLIVRLGMSAWCGRDSAISLAKRCRLCPLNLYTLRSIS